MTEASTSSGNFWTRSPLYLRILGGLIIGVILGSILRQIAPDPDNSPTWILWLENTLKMVSDILLKLLNAIALPLILVAVVRAIISAKVEGTQTRKLAFLLILNTLVAILIGLLVANVLQPGKHASLQPDTTPPKAVSMQDKFMAMVPANLFEPFLVNNSMGVILIALTVGLISRKLEGKSRDTVLHAADISFHIAIGALHWVIQIVPIAVLAKVAYIISHNGYGPFKALAWFIAAVLIALLLQAIYYLTRIRMGSWVRPTQLLRGTSDALVMAFSTASSTATMPLTYECLKDRVGLRERSASLGSLVGSNFNNDGTALYEAMSALFIAQLIGMDLSIGSQFIVVITSVIAAVGAAGIPEAGLVTMTLVFNAAGLPIEFIPLLLPVDWFLDRCRTAINVMGDMNVSCLLDGKTREEKNQAV